jgi:hypothetical protein
MRVSALAPLAITIVVGCSAPAPEPMSATIVQPAAPASATALAKPAGPALAKPSADDDEWESDPKKSGRANCLSHCEYAARKCIEVVTRTYPDEPGYLEGCANRQAECPGECPP